MQAGTDVHHELVIEVLLLPHQRREGVMWEDINFEKHHFHSGQRSKAARQINGSVATNGRPLRELLLKHWKPRAHWIHPWVKPEKVHNKRVWGAG